MPLHSLKNLLGMFPYFFDKSETSNFYKSQKITNNILKKVYQDLKDTYESFHLDKRLLVWKEQSVAYDYTMHFVVNFPLLKTVEIYCDGDLIYDVVYSLSSDETYSYLSLEHVHNYISSEVEDPENPGETISDISHEIYPISHDISEDIRVFDYSHNGTSENIIPAEQYLLKVTTYDEYTYVKGFPENDELKDDYYDHDISLDELGAENNVPRRQYLTINEDDFNEIELLNWYEKTDPPFNNQSSEDDYHYMKRLLTYLIKYHTTPLPVLEIWKLYGVDATLINRDKFILRLFDEELHPPDENGEFTWVPEPWEHKDFFADEDNIFGEYFFASANTFQPVKKQDIMLYLVWKNSLAEILTSELYSVDIFLNGDLLEEDYTATQYKVDWRLLSESFEGDLFTFHAKKDGVVVKVISFIVHVRGCGDADFYVIADNSDDTQDGSYNHPFHNLEDAIANVNGVFNLIAVFGDVELNEISNIKEKCTIIGCNNARIINNIDSSDFFKVAQGISLTMQDVTLVTPENTVTLDNDIWTNNNLLDLNENVVTPSVDYGVLLEDLNADTFMKDIKIEGNRIIYTELDKSDLTKLSDTNNLIQNFSLENNKLYYSEYTPATEEAYNLNLSYIYLEDRLKLVRAVKQLELENNNLISTEYGDEIAWKPESHLI